MTAGTACPACGFKPTRQPKALLTEDGELGLLGRDKRAKAKEWTLDEKLEFYGQLIWIALDRGYNPGWAFHKYKERFDKGPPNGPKPTPTPPKSETLSWVRSRAIAWAKGRRAA